MTMGREKGGIKEGIVGAKNGLLSLVFCFLALPVSPGALRGHCVWIPRNQQWWVRAIVVVHIFQRPICYLKSVRDHPEVCIVEITPIGIQQIGWRFWIVWTVTNAACLPIFYFFYPETKIGDPNRMLSHLE
jgi:hypothetical protein